MLSAIPFNRLWQQGHDLSNYKPILTPPSQIHGWPDLSLGWRYQIPLLVSLGLRVVAPDMMGYGGTVRSPFPLSPSLSILQKIDSAWEMGITC